MSRAILDSSPVRHASIEQPRKSLKRSASTASLPTPPATIENKNRYARSLSQASDRESDYETDGNDDDEARPSLGIEYTRLNFGRKKQRIEPLDSVVETLSGEDGDNPFWDGPATRLDVDDTRERSLSPPMRRSRFRAPVSPPPSRRQSSVSKLPRMESLQRLSLKEERAVDPIRDSPNNPFLSDSPGSASGELIEPRTPTEYTEKPTVTYVFRGVKAEFANPLYNLSPSVKARSLLPIEHPDFSPDPTCAPKMLFPEAHRRRRRDGSPTPVRSSRPAAATQSNQLVANSLAGDSNGWDDDDSDGELDITPPKRLVFRAPS